MKQTVAYTKPVRGPDMQWRPQEVDMARMRPTRADNSTKCHRGTRKTKEWPGYCHLGDLSLSVFFGAQRRSRQNKGKGREAVICELEAGMG